MSNALKTTLLLGLLTGLLMWVGQFVGGMQGMTLMLVVSIAINAGSYWFSDKIVLAGYGARALSEQDAPDLFRVVREHAAVAVTEGILRLLSLDELRGVLAHELSHVRNRDTLTSTIAATLAGVVMWVAQMVRWGMIFGGLRRDEREDGPGGLEALAMVILAPLAAMLIQLAISRAREYQADASGAQLSHAPQSLAAALEKIGAASGRIPLAAGPATAHLWIVNPLRGNWLAGLFSTHPPIDERIRRLRAMAY